MHCICKVTESQFFYLLACMNKKKIDEDEFFFLLIRKVGMTKYEEKRSVLGKSVIP